MKYAEFTINSNKIEFVNSIFGIERVLLNGKEVSKKFSFSGSEHTIKLNARDLKLEVKYSQFSRREIQLRLMESGNVVEKITIEADKKQRLFWAVCGVLTGFFAYQLLNILIGFNN